MAVLPLRAERGWTVDVDPLIDVAELAALCSTVPGPVLADCRFLLADPSAGLEQYQLGHLPGAHYLHLEKDLSGPLAQFGGRHPLPTAAAFEALMRRIGVNRDSLLVAYDDGSAAMAARLWWLARYFGHERVRVLDGGIDAWRCAGMEISSEPPPAAAGDFRAEEQTELRVDYPSLLEGAPSRVLVDAREPRRYAGIEEPLDPRAGHIPGALNAPWQESLAGGRRFLPRERQGERWSWLEPDAKVVVYCGSGVTACVNLLSLELAGRHGAQLYPGSWSDWCQHDGAVATGDA